MGAAGGRARKTAAVALAVLLPIVACSADDTGGEPTRPTSPPAVGDVVRLGLAGPVVVDPIEASLASASDLMVLDLLYDGLTRLDADGAVQPALATRWEADAAGTTFSFELAASASFASGEEVAAADVVASLERVMALGDTSLSALSLEAVTGFRAFVDGQAEHVSGLSAPDERTVMVGLTTPLSVLPEVLSSPLLGIVAPDSLDPDDPGSLDTSGGWAVDDVRDDVVRLGRRGETAGGPGGIELHPFEDADGAYEAFEGGKVDWATVPDDRYAQALEDHGDASFAPFHAELFFGMNLSSPVLTNPGLRQAILLAIDRDAIVQAVYPDRADPLATVVPAGVVGHDADRCGPCGHDRAAAAAALRAAYPDGVVPTVRIDFDASPAQEDMAGLVAGDLEDVGIPTELRPLPREEYKAFVVSGGQELFSFGWIGAYGSPDAYLAPLFGSAANDNLSDFRSAEVDALLAQARASADAAQRAEAWASAEGQILGAAAVVPIAQFRTQVVLADRVEGFVHAVDGTVDWTQVRLAD